MLSKKQRDYLKMLNEAAKVCEDHLGSCQTCPFYLTPFPTTFCAFDINHITHEWRVDELTQKWDDKEAYRNRTYGIKEGQ